MDSRRRLDMNTLRSRRAQERAAIIKKYEQGRRGVALLDPEEEDDEGGCLVPDRLGFLHEQKLPQDSNLGAKRKQVHRIQKWVKMMKNHSKYRGSEKFQRRIYKGIPAQVRGKVWAVMLEVDKKKAQNPSKYTEMKEQARLGATHFHHIDSTITWTFRNHLMFRERYGMNQHALFNILMAYSVYNPEVGYSQGLSHVVALLLMYMPEEDSFWALVQLMENNKHAMHGFYKLNTPKLERFQQHLGEIVHRVLPSLEKHLEKDGVCLVDSTTHWYIQGFLSGVPFPLALRMWDIYILEGEHVLTTMAYTALKIHHKRLLKMPRDQLREFLQVTLKQAWSLSEDAVIRQLRASMHELGKLQCLLPPEGHRTVRQAPGAGTRPPEARSCAHCHEGQDRHSGHSGSVGADQGSRCPCNDDPSSRKLWPLHRREGRHLEEESCEGSPEPLSVGSPVASAESPHVSSPMETPEILLGRGGLCQCASLPNLSGPGHREDNSSDAGSQEGLWMWAPPQASEHLEPGPMQAVPAWGPRLKTPPYWHGSLTHSRDSHGLEPARASPGLGDQARVPSLARGLLTSYSMGHLDDGRLLEERLSPPCWPRLGSSLPCVFMACYTVD